jgi:hypothetical protein
MIDFTNFDELSENRARLQAQLIADDRNIAGVPEERNTAEKSTKSSFDGISPVRSGHAPWCLKHWRGGIVAESGLCSVGVDAKLATGLTITPAHSSRVTRSSAVRVGREAAPQPRAKCLSGRCFASVRSALLERGPQCQHRG